jgi:hypothetical protein
MVASRGTDKENVPLARYEFQRVMARSRSSGAGPPGSVVTSSSAAKSSGVTSDTNQGIDFGLRDQIRPEPAVSCKGDERLTGIQLWKCMGCGIQESRQR